MVVYGSAEMADSGGSRFVGADAGGGDEVFGAGVGVAGLWRSGGGRGGSLEGWGSGCVFGAVALGCVGAEGEEGVEEGKAGMETICPYSWLEHFQILRDAWELPNSVTPFCLSSG